MGPRTAPLIYEDDSEAWFREILQNHHEEARQRALSLLDDCTTQPNGCITTPTTAPRKVKFRGRQVTAYRFIHCVLTHAIASEDHVVRHRCHNRLCVNPAHLELGSQADNKRDDWAYWAGGVDFDLL
jgi:hypothetical protein